VFFPQNRFLFLPCVLCNLKARKCECVFACAKLLSRAEIIVAGAIFLVVLG
jgi:hypothetical protein